MHIPAKKQATKTACENDQMQDLTKIFKSLKSTNTEGANSWKRLSNGFELAEEPAHMKTEQYIMQLEEN